MPVSYMLCPNLGSASFVGWTHYFLKHPLKDPTVQGQTYILLPSNQIDGLASAVYPGCVTVILLTSAHYFCPMQKIL